MKTTDENTRPFGFWITAVDRLMRAEFATVFEDEGITRRDWRMLNRIDGHVTDGRPLHARKLYRLIELGWVERTRGGFGLTDAGALAKQRLGTAVDELRARVAGAVSPEEYAAMTDALEKIARAFGWEDGKRLPRGAGRDRGRPHGHRHARRSGHGHGFGGHGHGSGGHGSGGHGSGGHGHGHGSGGHGSGGHGHGSGGHGHGHVRAHEHGFDRRPGFGERVPEDRGHLEHHTGGHRPVEMARGVARGHHCHGAPDTHIHIHAHG